MRVFVGTSGWQYRDWRGRLYPESVPQRRWLEIYARAFGTVELNNAFYRLPEATTFAGWRDRTPPGFVMAVKASRFLTHVRRLANPEEPVARLMDRASALGDRLGPVLLQLPPNLAADLGRLDACLACFPPGVRVAVEPRHPSWWTADTEAVLRARGAALCWADRSSRPVTPLWRPTRWGYLRLHVGRAQPWPRYGTRALAGWVSRVAAPPAAGGDGAGDFFVYFNNDRGGAAVEDAGAFCHLARRAGLGVVAPAGGTG